MTISAEAFWQAFQAEYDRAVAADPDGAWAALSTPSGTTAWMKDGDDSILRRVADALTRTSGTPLGLRREWYTIDALLVSGIDLFRTDLRYPSELHALIEHENGEHLEEEMWKLVHWRSPLKVLIAYDYTEQAKSGDERYAGWLEAKQQSLHRLHAAVGAFCPEAPGTEYLLIVGCRDQALRVLTWRAWRLAPTGWGDALPAGSQSALNPSTSAGTASTANAAGV